MLNLKKNRIYRRSTSQVETSITMCVVDCRSLSSESTASHKL